ncbi:plasmid mobilization protein [Klebsiella quasipneumoniae]|uniref:plasmid mobilization protein n=1 Tax=Klebsiella quasipneumoniae TaxID=1463165 RepID=UPI00387B29F5
MPERFAPRPVSFNGRHLFGAALLTRWLFRPAPSRRGGVCSLLSSSFQGGARVPFVCIGDEPLTAKLALRLQPDERDALRAEADARGVSMSALVRDLYFGAPVVSDVNRDLVAELIRLGAVVRSAWDASAASQSPYFPPRGGHC